MLRIGVLSIFIYASCTVF